jgi:hypothetical protein
MRAVGIKTLEHTLSEYLGVADTRAARRRAVYTRTAEARSQPHTDA